MNSIQQALKNALETQWPGVLVAINEYAMHVTDASNHASASKSDISQTAALSSLGKLRGVIQGALHAAVEAVARAALEQQDGKTNTFPDPTDNDLDDDHPLSLINSQLVDLFQGFAAPEDHEDILSFLRNTGLPENTVRKMHEALATFHQHRGKAAEQDESGLRRSIIESIRLTIDTLGEKFVDAFDLQDPDALGSLADAVINGLRKRAAIVPLNAPTTYPPEKMAGMYAAAPTVEPEEGAPGEAGLRWEIGHALSNTLGNTGEDGAVSIDPFDSDNIDPLVDAVIGVLRGRGIPVERAGPLTNAARDVLAERQRQVSAEGWTPEHDDEHVNSELSHAAGIYAIYGDVSAYGASNPPADWPWAAEWWKPSASQRRNLVKAGALILAEIERLDRAAPAEGEKQ